MRGDGARALATFARAPRNPLDRVVSSLALGARGVAPILDAKLAGNYAVLFEAEPAGLPLSTSMFPLALDLALAVFGKLLEIAADAAARGEVIRGLRPELVYLDRGLVVAAAPRAERFAMSAPESRDVSPTSPFETLYCGPESVSGENATAAYDVFSCCAMFLYLLTRRAPFPGANVMHQVAAMMKGPPALPAGLDPRTAELVRQGLSPDPKKRPSARDLAAAVVVS
jgi:serine/threonine protein kinase